MDNNRLAPYNPTHISAQGRALDLLQLTSNDIFFDLGCGDGRLILAAIDRYYSSSSSAATANSSNDEYATNDNNGEEEDEDGSRDSNIDRPSIINRRQSTRSSGEKTTVVSNNITGINNDYLNNSLTTKVSNLTLSNSSFGYNNNWNSYRQSQSSSVLSSSFFIDATANNNNNNNKSTNATTTTTTTTDNDNNNSNKISNSNNSDDYGSTYNVFSREGSKSFDNDKSESEYSFPHMMRMRSADDDDDNGNEDAEYSFPHLMRMKSGSQDDFIDDNYNHYSNDNDEITSRDMFDNGSDTTTQLSSSPFGPHLGGVMMEDRVSSSGVSQLQPPPTLSPTTPITPQTDNCKKKKKKKDHDVLYCQNIDVFDDAVSSPMMLCPAIPYDDEDDDDAHDVDDDDDDDDVDDDNHNNDNNSNNNHKMYNEKVGIPKTIKTTLPKDDNDDDDIDDDDNDNNVYNNEQQNTKKKQQQPHHHHRNYFTSSLTTYSAYPIQEQTLFSTPTEKYSSSNNYDSDNEEEGNFALTTQTLETIPSGDELITNANTNNNYNDEYENDDGTIQSPKPLLLPCEKHEITSNKSDEQQQQQSNSSNSSATILQTSSWLRCVGIEVNQALAKSAQENVRQKIMLYMTSFSQQEQQQQSLMNSVYIHWGDVIEEINRSRHNNNNNDSPHSGCNDKNAAEDSGTGNALHVSWHDGYGNDIRDRTVVNNKVSNSSPSTTTLTTTNDEEINVSELTLLDDATAVFIYLLPKGLEKIKPILHAAALIRHEQRELQISRHSHQKPSLSTQLFRQQQHNQLHPLHKSPQLRTLDEKEDISAMFLSDVPSYDNGEMEFCPLPQQHHRKRGDSHVSDITDDTFCNFTRASLEGMGLEVLKILHEDESNGATTVEPRLVMSTRSEQRLSNKKMMQLKKTMIEESEMIIPSFRVVSYMFQIPGWTPVMVDRSSKGQCPLYLYENIHEEDT